MVDSSHLISVREGVQFYDLSSYSRRPLFAMPNFPSGDYGVQGASESRSPLQPTSSKESANELEGERASIICTQGRSSLLLRILMPASRQVYANMLSCLGSQSPVSSSCGCDQLGFD